MTFSYEVGPYDPCPCGSGNTYKFCCAAKAKANRHGKYPVGTVTLYGPDDKVTTKIAAGVVLREGAEPAYLERWVGATVLSDPNVAAEVRKLFARHGVKSVVATQGNIGCPHEEGADFPYGQDCPLCPFWKGKQGTARRDFEDDWDDEEFSILPLGTANEDTDDAEELELDLEDDEAADEPHDADAVFSRAAAILGDRELDRDEELDLMLAHLRANLTLPCEVTGIEDFQWEERYVIGGWSAREYARLKITQPSYTDRYQLLSIDRARPSPWMMFSEDIAARVKRASDGKPFILGLSELETTDKNSSNYQLLDDYSVWFINTR